MMSNLKDLNVDILEDLDLTDLKIDLPYTTESENIANINSTETMDKEEIEFALSCVMNIKKHLVRAINVNEKESLQDNLAYVNDLIFDAGLEASSL